MIALLKALPCSTGLQHATSCKPSEKYNFSLLKMDIIKNEFTLYSQLAILFYLYQKRASMASGYLDVKWEMQFEKKKFHLSVA